ncbi:MAG: hypothetical protein K6E10_06890 [Eubacterium sp.]|nr:hypothetical protein [Eubacterium sp.]
MRTFFLSLIETLIYGIGLVFLGKEVSDRITSDMVLTLTICLGFGNLFSLSLGAIYKYLVAKKEENNRALLEKTGIETTRKHKSFARKMVDGLVIFIMSFPIIYLTFYAFANFARVHYSFRTLLMVTLLYTIVHIFTSSMLRHMLLPEERGIFHVLFNNVDYIDDDDMDDDEQD